MLSVLGSAFVLLTRIERKAALQTLCRSRAILLARSGLEDAMARLARGQDPAYGGEDYDGDGFLDAGVETAQQVWQAARLDTDACPLRHALRPSFFAGNGTGLGATPVLLAADSGLRGYSGRLARGGTYALQASGCDGIHVNGGDLTSAGEHLGTFDLVLKRVLGNLAEEIDRTALPAGDGSPVGRADGERLITLRPKGGWKSMDQARATLGWTAAKAEALSPFLAFRAWTDKKVIRPQIDRREGSLIQAPSMAEWATRANGAAARTFNARTSSYAPDFERDSQGRVVGRAPINLHWLRRRPEALRAILPVIRGRSPQPTNLAPGGAGSALSAMCPDVELSASEIDEVVAAFAGLGPSTTYAGFPTWDGTWSIDSWEELNHFVTEKIPFTSSTDFRLKQDLLRAAFNPNTDSIKGNPNLTLAKQLDKADLYDRKDLWDLAVPAVKWRESPLELSFSTPVQRLTALGRVTDVAGRVLASATLSVEVMLHDQLRLTAQSEFCAGDGGLGKLDIAGDESGFRMPGTLGFVTANTGLVPSYGSKSRWNNGNTFLLGNDENGRPFQPGVSLQTYPEPQWPPGAAQPACPPPACWDGNLQLATHTTPNFTGMYGAAGTMRFLASWERGLNADWAGAGPMSITWPLCVLDPDLQHPGSEGVSILGSAPNSSKVNVLRPDGLYSEDQRTPGYAMNGNVTANASVRHGAVSFWVKPAVPLSDPSDTPSKSGTYWYPMGRSSTFLNLSRVPDPSLLAKTQLFFLAGSGSFAAETGIEDPGEARFGGYFEIAARNTTGDDLGYEYLDSVRARTPLSSASPRRGGAHQWFLLTYQWNMASPTWAGLHRLTVDTARTDPGTYAGDLANTIPFAAAAEDLCAASLPTFASAATAPHRFFLGSSWVDPYTDPLTCTRGCLKGDYATPIGPANATFDEFALYDLGTDLNQGSTLATNRYMDGRYYKEDDGRWTSCVIPLPAGSRILGLDWTLLMPPLDPTGGMDPNRMFYGNGSDLTENPAVPRRSADALLEILKGASPAYASNRDGVSRNRFALALPDGRFRLRATLRPWLGDNSFFWDKSNRPLLDSPVLDDITVLWSPPGGPRILDWAPGP